MNAASTSPTEVVTNGGNAGPTVGVDPTPAISLANVSVGYRGTPVVTGVSLEVPVGGWLSIIGPNGAGKSTVLKAIVGVLAYEGMLEVDGVAQTKGSSARAVGYVPQKPVLPPGMTTAEYALLGRTAHLGWFGSESGGDRDRVADVFDRLDMAHLASRPIIELSGGEAQRAALARALVQEASVLVLDEPTSALDLANQIGVLELVNELRHEQGLAVISAMHDLSMAGRFSDQLALLAGGTVAAHGSPEDVLTEDILSLHYRTPVSVMRGPDDQLVVVPLRTGATVSSAAANRPTSHDRNNGEVDV